ncbi:Outer membrane protein assembly factor BamD [invertebrate metagenome]|uniref:Outer membrane protein assembly factor BamD n=1 Tax=invertebrate metagenome TaxID=1711999 RepID=A0A2H9TAX4_9ZZZZ
MRLLKFLLTRQLSALMVATLVAFSLAGCAGSGKDKLPESLSEADLYHMSGKALDDRDYSKAVNALRTLESRYPFGPFAQQALLDIVYAYYMNSEPEASRAAADRFIRLYPQNNGVDYALYLKGLASNTASMGFIERYIPLDSTRRDPGQARQSFNEFADLLNRYPDSKYAPDARQRMVALRNRLAAYEIHAANYYLKRKAFMAAINRGRYVVENMQQTPSVPEALAIMIESYQHLGLNEPANQSLEVLRLNYPDNEALDKDGNFVHYKVFDDVNPSLLNTMTFGLFGKTTHQEQNSDKKSDIGSTTQAKLAMMASAPKPPKLM